MNRQLNSIGLLGVLALPATVLLAGRYETYEARVREVAGPRFAVTLSDEEVLQRVREQMPSTAGATARLVWKPELEPRTGIASVQELSSGGTPQWRILTIRHDIECSVCRDVYAAAVYHLADDELAKVVLLDDWEVGGERVGVGPFLSRLAGTPRQQRLTLVGNVDGISGATKSVDGLVRRLNEAGAWTSGLAVR